MDAFSLTTTASFSVNRSLIPSFSATRTTRNLSFSRRPRFLVSASSKDDSKLDPWDNMELKFGHLLGEDPKLTLAKIMGRKSNPDVSYLEIEKSFYKRKGKLLDNDIEDVPFDGTKEGQSSDSLDGVNLVRPVPKKGIKFKADDKSVVPEIKKPNQSVAKAVDNRKGSIPNVILRKPTMFNEDDVETEKSSKLRIKPNLFLKMRKDQENKKFSDMTLLRKPEPMSVNANLDEEKESSGKDEAKVIDDIELRMGKEQANERASDISLSQKPKTMTTNTNLDEKQKLSGIDDIEENSLEGGSVSSGMVNTTMNNFEESLESVDASLIKEPRLEGDSVIGLQPRGQSDVGLAEMETAVRELPDTNLEDSSVKYLIETALQGKPKRLDQSVKETSNSSTVEAVLIDPESYGNAVELENFLASSPLKEHEDTDWKRAEDMVKTGGREEVELISSSTRGFVVSFGSLIGFLPYRNLAAKWKFLAFESWLRRKGLDPSIYRQNLGIIGSYDVANKTTSLDSSMDPEIDQKLGGEISPDMKLEDLLRIYDQEKIKFLSSFVGQRIKVNVVLADRKSRKLIFSVRPKEKEEFIEKKRSLMAKLSVGDVVKCCIKKITYFGIFVEVEGVPALIHQTEVSWDATLDPASYYKIGQIVEAKVHQLDFSLERIFLSLKEITPDPLIEALESVVRDRNSLEGRLEAAEADTEWADVESLIKELQQIEGIQSVSKGRYFLSPGLAPTFQVYMASMFENQYKLLARSGNKVQEVIVESSLGKDEMKSAILTCTNRVE
ncbi:hypothetical protein L1049_006928 [Liquidambar formosana]|uniref:S1 motif domain-containing protein n=1 Tax=Liquidambar formosana TaxID=63359 RepID=A0AAP0RI16_LIQFO